MHLQRVKTRQHRVNWDLDQMRELCSWKPDDREDLFLDSWLWPSLLPVNGLGGRGLSGLLPLGEVRRVPRVPGALLRRRRGHAHGPPAGRGQVLVHVRLAAGDPSARAGVSALQTWRSAARHRFLCIDALSVSTQLLIKIVKQCLYDPCHV